MSLQSPVPDAEERLCPKCGMLQESIGSTVCEQCGADLIEAAQTKPVVSPVPPPIFSTQPPAVSSPQPASRPPRGVTVHLPAVSLHLLVRRTGPILGLLVHRIGSILGALIRGLVAIPLLVLGGIVVAVQRLVSLILRAVSLALRAAAMMLGVGVLVVGLSYVPAVRAAVPITKEVTVRSDAWLKQAQGLGGSLLGQLQQRVQLRLPPQLKPDVRTARPARSATPPKPPAPARRATSQVSLAITSTPPGATVLLNQRRIGKAPLTVKVAPGTYRLTVSHPGFLSMTRTVTVKAGQPTSLDIVLSQPP